MRPGGGSPALGRRLGTLAPAMHCTTSITLGELLYGAHKRRSERLQREIRTFVDRDVHIAPFDTSAARSYAMIRVQLEAAGQRIDDADLRIAAICIAHDLTLVTGNVRHFERVPGLRVENWLE